MHNGADIGMEGVLTGKIPVQRRRSKVWFWGGRGEKDKIHTISIQGMA